jgi:hypothetical protein
MSKVTPPKRTGSPAAQNTNTGRLSCSPCQSALPNDSACYEVSVDAAGSKQSVVAAQRARRRGSYCEGRPRLGGVGEEHLAGIGRQWERLERQVEGADDQVG